MTYSKLSKLFLLGLCSQIAITQSSQAVLTAGDIVITGYHGDNTDAFSWVPLVDLTAGETIYFSDAGYQSGVGFAGSGSVSEWLLAYTTPAGGVPKGTVQTVTDSNSVPTNYANFTLTKFGARDVSSNGINLNGGAGDSVIAFQSTDSPTNSSFGDSSFTALFSIDTHDTPYSFDTNGTSTTTDTPVGLADGSTAVSSNMDNTRYTGPKTGTRAALLAAITNDANWERTNDPQTAGWTNNLGTNFTVTEVPEPSSLLMLSLAGLSMLNFRRR